MALTLVLVQIMGRANGKGRPRSFLNLQLLERDAGQGH